MSLFDTNIIEQTMYVRHAYDIRIESFSPNLFYKWIWKEKGIEYPPRSALEGIPKQLLYDIFVDKLGKIRVDDFIKWEKELVKYRSSKHFRKYFKKLIKREYMPNVTIGLKEGHILVCIPYNNVFGAYIQMVIIFHRK